MYIKGIAHYLPSQRVTNQYFAELNGLTHEWIVERTGIEERRKAGPDENTHTMAVEAVKQLQLKTDFPLQQVDLIVSPVSPTTAFKMGQKTDDPLEMYLADVMTLAGSLAGFLVSRSSN